MSKILIHLTHGPEAPTRASDTWRRGGPEWRRQLVEASAEEAAGRGREARGHPGSADDRRALGIQDDGKGFDAAALQDRGGVGLNSMRERAEQDSGGAPHFSRGFGDESQLRFLIRRTDQVPLLR